MIGGLAVLADRGVFAVVAVLLIAARELGISLYRSVAGRRGIVLPAQRLGKYKAFTQYIAVGFVLLPISADWLGVQKAGSPSQWCSRSCRACRSSAMATSTGNAPNPNPPNRTESQPNPANRRR